LPNLAGPPRGLRANDAECSVPPHSRQPAALKLRDNRHIGDFHAWTDRDVYQCTLERLLRDLRVETPDAAPG
jgi:hypothetical protein